MSDLDAKISQKINGVTGPIIAPITTGNKNSISINHGDTNKIEIELTLSGERLDRVQDEYVTALKEFIAKLNPIIKENKIEPQKISEIQDDLNKWVEEIKDANPKSEISKKECIRSKFFSFAKKMVKHIPKTAQIIASVTPLAPLSPLIGSTAETIIEQIQKEN